jgi:hypothetical protein
MAEPSDNDVLEFSWWPIIGIFVAAVILITLIGIIVPTYTGYTLRESMLTVGTIGSISLSAILAFLYYRMSRIQQRQATISSKQQDLMGQQAEFMEKQKELMKKEFEPELIRGDLEFSNGDFAIELTNLGDNAAKYVALGANINPESGNWGSGPHIPLRRRDADERGGHLQFAIDGREEGVWFERKVPSYNPVVALAMGELVDEVKWPVSVEFDLYVQYQGSVENETYRIGLGKDEFEITEATTLHDLIRETVSD